jgi:phosphoribosylanthranilate isomerase
MFQVKICGITTTGDAQAAARAGADAIGLNFYRGSPRFVTEEQARAIVECLPPGVVRVGLFVDTAAAEVCETFSRLGLDLIQLHGDQPPEFLAGLGGRPVMRAFRLGSAGLMPLRQYLERCKQLGCLPRLVLIDAHVPGVFGGTGTVADWRVARECADDRSLPPLVLAGGLTPMNVAEAIHTVRPAAVDTASGVEHAHGRKDPAAMTAFVTAARAALHLVNPPSGDV